MKTKELSAVPVGSIFELAGISFVKLDEEGGHVLAVSKKALFNSKFGKGSDLGKSVIKNALEEEWLPKIEKAVGTENILEFETDLLALDGTRPFENVVSKVSLPTLDIYRKYRNVFARFPSDSWWWLATPDSEECSSLIHCVSPSGLIDYYFCYNCSLGVRPFCHFVSSILVSCDE